MVYKVDRATQTLHAHYKQPQYYKMNTIHMKMVCAQKGVIARQNSDVHRAKEQETREIQNRLTNYILLSYVQFELISMVTIYHDM